MRAFQTVVAADPIALSIGGYAAAFGHRWGAWVLLGYLGWRATWHLTAGIWAYQRVMSRTWPDVPALDDWDD